MDRLETKAAFQIDDAGEITGNAWPFGTPDHYGDMIVKGAFAGATVPVPMLAHHDPKKPVGVWTSVEETAEGLVVKGQLLIEEVALARELHALAKRGAITGLSIGFSGTKGQKRPETKTLRGGRTIHGLDLHEISLVTIPAHPNARILTAKSSGNAVALAEAIQRAATALRLPN